MSKYNFPYLSYPKKDPKTGKIIGKIYYPFIPVRICYKHQFLKNPIHALVDSGTEIDFSYEQEIPLLGRIKFFDQFKRVTFKEKEKIIEFEK